MFLFQTISLSDGSLLYEQEVPGSISGQMFDDEFRYLLWDWMLVVHLDVVRLCVFHSPTYGFLVGSCSSNIIFITELVVLRGLSRFRLTHGN